MVHPKLSGNQSINALLAQTQNNQHYTHHCTIHPLEACFDSIVDEPHLNFDRKFDQLVTYLVKLGPVDR